MMNWFRSNDANAVAEKCVNEVSTILSLEFPQLSILDQERQSIASKRDRLRGDVEDFDAAVSYHEREAEKHRADKADTLRILAGLDKHEAEIGVTKLADLEDQISGAARELAAECHAADEILQDRRNRTERKRPAKRPHLMAAAE